MPFSKVTVTNIFAICLSVGGFKPSSAHVKRVFFVSGKNDYSIVIKTPERTYMVPRGTLSSYQFSGVKQTVLLYPDLNGSRFRDAVKLCDNYPPRKVLLASTASRGTYYRRWLTYCKTKQFSLHYVNKPYSITSKIGRLCLFPNTNYGWDLVWYGKQIQLAVRENPGAGLWRRLRRDHATIVVIDSRDGLTRQELPYLNEYPIFAIFIHVSSKKCLDMELLRRCLKLTDRVYRSDRSEHRVLELSAQKYTIRKVYLKNKSKSGEKRKNKKTPQKFIPRRSSFSKSRRKRE